MGTSESLFIYAVIFFSAFLALQAVLGNALESRSKKDHRNKRLKMQDKELSNEELLMKMRRDRGLNKEGSLQSLNYRVSKAVLHSGLPLGPYMIYVLTVIAAIIGAIAGYLFFRSVPYTIGAGLAGSAVPFLVVLFFVNRRRNKAAAQLPDSLDVIVRSLKAGHPVPTSLGLVAKEMPDPIGSEFGIAGDEISFGSHVSHAIQRMADRVGQEDFDLFAAMVRLQEKTGGNLAELLASNANTIRARQRMRLKIKAASSEGRMSALILNCAPIILFVAINALNPNFYGDVEDSKVVEYGLYFAGFWMFLGNLVMRKMINFRI